MRIKVVGTLFGLSLAVAACLTAQEAPPPAQAGRGAAAAGRRSGGFVPGQQRPPGDPVQIARGKTLYGISCTGCHGADLRGGDIGGPNLLRSQVALSDRNGELISVDSRPSDALAIALRLDCPIYVEEQVLKTSKQAANVGDKVNNEELRRWLEGLNDEDLGRYKM